MHFQFSLLPSLNSENNYYALSIQLAANQEQYDDHAVSVQPASLAKKKKKKKQKSSNKPTSSCKNSHHFYMVQPASLPTANQW